MDLGEELTQSDCEGSICGITRYWRRMLGTDR